MDDCLEPRCNGEAKGDDIKFQRFHVGDLCHLFSLGQTSKSGALGWVDQRVTPSLLDKCRRRVVNSNGAEPALVAKQQNPKLRLTDAGRTRQYGLENGFKFSGGA